MADKHKGLSSLRVKVSLNNIPIYSTVDTGCSKSVISYNIFNKFKVKPTYLSSKTMNTAEKDKTIIAKLLSPIKIEIGPNILFKSIYVANIKDDMLLGLDILYDLHAQIDVTKGILKCRNNELNIIHSKSTIAHLHTTAKLNNDFEIKPFTEKIIQLNTFGMDECVYMHFQPKTNLPILLPNALFTGKDKISISVINDTPNTWFYKQNTTLGHVASINPNEILEVDSDKPATDNIYSLEINHDDIFPEHLIPLIKALHHSLSKNECDTVKNLLFDFKEIFATHDYDIGNYDGYKHKIITTNDIPISQPLRRTPVAFLDDERKLIDNLLKHGIIEPSNSAFSSPTILIRKKDGGIRFVLDYRLLNDKTVPDAFPLPLLRDCIDSLANNNWFSILDSNMAYFQLKLDENTKYKTAFKTRFGLYEFNRMPQGLCNSPSSYMRAMNLILRDLNWTNCLVYLDDICVIGKTFNEHLNNLFLVFSRLKNANIKLKAKKCKLFVKTIDYLGRKISPNGITLSDHSIDTIKKWKQPKTKKELERFLGLVNYSRQFIENFAFKSEPLLEVLRNKKFFWNKEQTESFNTLQNELISPNILTIPQNIGKFVLYTDSSAFSIGSELKQIQNNEEKTIEYTSHALTRQQRRWCSTKRELFAVLKACYAHRHLLLGREFDIICDCHSLIWLRNFRNVEGILARWLEQLAQFNYKIIFRRGKHLQNADSLSRRPLDDPCLKVPNYYYLPCGRCEACIRLEKKWQQFDDEVNDVVSLATNMKNKLSNTGYDTPVNSHKNSSNLLDSLSILFADNHDTPKLNDAVINIDHSVIPLTNETISQNNYNNEETNNMQPDQTFDIQVLNADTNTTRVKSSMLAIDNQEMIEAQSKDPQLIFLYDYLNNNISPDMSELQLSGPKAHHYMVNKNMYHLVNGVIYKQNDEVGDLLVVPDSLIQKVLELSHDVVLSGHQGINRTKQRVKSNYYWYGMSKDIKIYVNSCATCAQMKTPSKNIKHPKIIDTSGIIMNKCHFDFCGPFVRTERDNAHILVMVDSFSKYIECVPLSSPTAELTAQTAVTHFFSKFGFPSQVHSDRGTNFISDLYTEVCRMLKIRTTFNVAQRPSGNGQVERYMRNLSAAIRCFVGKNPTDWDLYVPLIASALRSSVNRHTGFTANYLMFGREISFPSDLMVPDNKVKVQYPIDFVNDLRTKIEIAHEAARNTLKTQLKITKKFADIKSRTYPFKLGQPVYFLDKNRKNKLSPIYIGPALITKIITPQNVKIQLKNARTPKVVNVDFLKPCMDRNLPAWLTKQQKLIVKDMPLTFCICSNPDDGNLMLQCIECLNWFHAHCVKISKNKARQLTHFKCPTCVIDAN